MVSWGADQPPWPALPPGAAMDGGWAIGPKQWQIVVMPSEALSAVLSAFLDLGHRGVPEALIGALRRPEGALRASWEVDHLSGGGCRDVPSKFGTAPSQARFDPTMTP